MNKTAIVRCRCVSEYQDRQYGKQMRMANPVNRLQKEGVYAVRCTVCGATHQVSQSVRLAPPDNGAEHP